MQSLRPRRKSNTNSRKVQTPRLGVMTFAGHGRDQRERQLLEAVSQTAKVLCGSGDLETSATEACRILVNATGVDRLNVFRFDYSLQAGFVFAHYDRPALSLPTSHSEPFSLEDYREVWTPLMKGDVYSSATVLKLGANRDLNERLGVKTDLIVPIFEGDRFWGALNFDDCTAERVWDNGEIEVLRTAAEIFGAALQRARLESEAATLAAAERSKEAERINQLLQTVITASRELLLSPTLQSGLSDWCKVLAAAGEADRVTVGVYVRELTTGEINPRALIDWTRPDFPPVEGVEIPRSADFCAWTERLRKGEHVWATWSDLQDPASRERWRIIRCAANLIVPVVVNGVAWGWLCFDFARERPYDPVLTAVLRAAADGVAAAIRRDEAHLTLAQEREVAAKTRTQQIEEANAAMREALATLALNSELEQFLETMVRESLRVAGAHSGGIALVSGPVGEELVEHPILIWNGTVMSAEEKARRRLEPLRLEEPLRRYWNEIQSSDALSGSDASSEAHIGGFRAFHKEAENNHIRCLALRVSGRAIGWLGLGFREPSALSLERLSLLRLLADQMTMAIEIHRLGRDAREAAVIKERGRIAGQIHDTLAQGFTGLLLHLEALIVRSRRGQTISPDELTRVRKIAALGLAEARRSTVVIRPLELDGRDLPTALQQLAERSGVPGLLECEWILRGTPRAVSEKIEEAFLNIAHEAVTNAIRHSEATKIRIRLTFSARRIAMTISDDGCGFDASLSTQRGRSFGLQSMRDRTESISAKLSVKSQSGYGTSITVAVPLR